LFGAKRGWQQVYLEILSSCITSSRLQQVTWTAVSDILGHHRRHGDGATTALAKTHLANNICSGDDTHHCAALVADNDKIDVSAIEKPGNLRQQSVAPDRNKTFPCHRHYFLHSYFLLSIVGACLPAEDNA
jgi:hypothetical protein